MLAGESLFLMVHYNTSVVLLLPNNYQSQRTISGIFLVYFGSSTYLKAPAMLQAAVIQREPVHGDLAERERKFQDDFKKPLMSLPLDVIPPQPHSESRAHRALTPRSTVDFLREFPAFASPSTAQSFCR